MSDEEIGLGEMYRLMNADSKARRAHNRESSAAKLQQNGIEFESRNDGAHLLVGAWDFWPGTGLWCNRQDRSIRGRGVAHLIKRIRETNP